MQISPIVPHFVLFVEQLLFPNMRIAHKWNIVLDVVENFLLEIAFAQRAAGIS